MGVKMLVIDDDDDVLESCRVIFTDEGYDVVTTNSPDQGLRLFSDSNFDVVLCDWKMPQFDGVDGASRKADHWKNICYILPNYGICGHRI